MAAQPQRTLVDRWYFGILPATWERAGQQLQSRLDNLARVLGILHRAVEHPAPTLAANLVTMSANLSVTSTTATALTGATVTYTPDVDMVVQVAASFDCECNLFGSITHVFVGSLQVNGVMQTGAAACSAAALGHRQMPAQRWHVALAAGTPYAIALYGATTNVATTFLLRTNTRFSIARFPELFTP